jgi:hypothetical protein
VPADENQWRWPHRFFPPICKWPKSLSDSARHSLVSGAGSSPTNVQLAENYDSMATQLIAENSSQGAPHSLKYRRERKMPSGTAIVVSAVFASFVAGVALTTVSGSAARAGDDCITEPKDRPPPGSHWYYHLDHVTQRKCWHQRAEGLTIHQVGPSKPSPPPKSIVEHSAEVGYQRPTADAHAEQPIAEAQPTAAGLTGQSTPETSADATGGENLRQSIPSSHWRDQQSSNDLNDREPGLARRAATDTGIDSKAPVLARDQLAAAERPPESSMDRMLFVLLVGALALTAATGRLIFKYSAARRPRRGDILDQPGSAWEGTELSHTFSADVSTRQATVVCDLPGPRELGCATEELRQLLVQLAEYGTFSRWPPMPQRNVDPSFSYNPGGASRSLAVNQRNETRHRHVRQRASQ